MYYCSKYHIVIKLLLCSFLIVLLNYYYLLHVFTLLSICFWPLSALLQTFYSIITCHYPFLTTYFYLIIILVITTKLLYNYFQNINLHYFVITEMECKVLPLYICVKHNSVISKQHFSFLIHPLEVYLEIITHAFSLTHCKCVCYSLVDIEGIVSVWPHITVVTLQTCHRFTLFPCILQNYLPYFQNMPMSVSYWFITESLSLVVRSMLLIQSRLCHAMCLSAYSTNMSSEFSVYDFTLKHAPEDIIKMRL